MLKTNSRSHYSVFLKFIRELRISPRRLLAYLVLYYTFTLITAFLNAIGIVFVTSLLTNANNISSINIPWYLNAIVNVTGLAVNVKEIIPLVTVIFGLNLVLTFALLYSEGYIVAWLRRKFQEAVFKSIIRGDWVKLRSMNVGEAVGTNTHESILITKYCTSTIKTGYFLLSASMFATIAALTSINVFVAFIFIFTPLAFVVKKTISEQTRTSRRLAELRNEFAADITDRFNGLFQIHVEDNNEFHIQKGLNAQKPLMKSELLIAYYSAVISSFNQLVPFVGLCVVTIWLVVTRADALPNVTMAASVGVLGLRLTGQVNSAIASLGNLSRLSGSIHPILNSLELPQVRKLERIKEPISKVIINASYSYSGREILKDVDLTLECGCPTLLYGKSGKGKTTLANLISGLYIPETGSVLYECKNKNQFNSINCRAAVGYVTQDIYLFKGTLRDNLAIGKLIDDKFIWEILERVSAAKFVQELGGLDSQSTEAGRSLSGGQRRRLGIARVLLCKSDILIFDEITAGLDTENKQSLMELITSLSREHIVVLISHDEVTRLNHKVYQL